jgi:hypothetical protein
MKITIEHDGQWWDYNVYHEKRHLCGTASDLRDALDAILDASDRIKETPRNTRRNP